MSIKYDTKVDEIRKIISNLLQDIINASQTALQAYEFRNFEKFLDTQKKLNNIEIQGDIIDNEVIKTFALFGPEAKELRSLVAYLKMTNEIVSIGDGVKKYARRMKEHCESSCDLEPFDGTIIQLHKSTLNALRYILECFTEIDICNIEDNYRKVMIEESKNDDLFALIEKDIMNMIMNEKELSIEYVRILSTLRKLERSCDRSVNIANLMLYAEQGGAIRQYS
jgi:phosphate transport system protein